MKPAIHYLLAGEDETECLLASRHIIDRSEVTSDPAGVTCRECKAFLECDAPPRTRSEALREHHLARHGLVRRA
jgi:hypothetical protein